MYKKRLFSSLLIASLMVGIAGCGQPKAPSDSSTTLETSSNQEIVGQKSSQESKGQEQGSESNSQAQDSSSQGKDKDQASHDATSQSGPGPDGKYSDEEYQPRPAKSDFDVTRQLSDITLNEDGSQLLSHVSGVYAEPFELYLAADANGNLSQAKTNPDTNGTANADGVAGTAQTGAAPTQTGDIYYTLDGSDPASSDTAILYTGPIPITDRKGDANVVSAVDPLLISGNFNKPIPAGYAFTCWVDAPSDEAVDKCTVVRAVLKKADGTYEQASCGTYFIGTTEEHIQGISQSCKAAGTTLAVIHISMDFDDLFDSEKGIYVKGDIFEKALGSILTTGKKVKDGETARSLDANYKQRGREWERNAHLTMFEMAPEGAVQVLNQDCGIRVQGNYSRSDLQKGLRLYARADYGKKNFKYAVFGEEYKNDAGETMDKFKKLVLRAGGNCAFTSKFNDAFWQSLLRDTAVETKQSRPCVVYINGEYWGLYVLEEDYTDDYFEDLHGVNKDNVVVYKGDAESYEIGYELDEGEIPEGESVDYYFKDLLAFFESHENLKSQKDYDEFTKLVDPDSVLDYFAVQSWINNKWDWPGKNWSMWRTTVTEEGNPYGDNRWRFMFYDVEFGGVSGGGDARTNTIKEDNYQTLGLLDMNTENPAVLCFAYLMTNEDFQNKFYDRLLGLSEGHFEQEKALAKLEEFEAIYGPLYQQFFDRYPGTGNAKDALNGGYATARCIRDFLKERENHIQKMVDWCEKILK